jgi:small subunit ribosomal protein S6
MPLYEHVFMARQDISQAQVDALIKEFQGVVEEGGGKIVRIENAGLKNIAYKIKKNRKAHYALLNIDAPSAAVSEMERRMRLSTDIIRFQTIRVEEHENDLSALSRKSDREDRGPRGGRGDRDGRPPRSDGPRGPRRMGDDRGPRPPRDQIGE